MLHGNPIAKALAPGGRHLTQPFLQSFIRGNADSATLT
jgi:hypothetical protein